MSSGSSSTDPKAAMPKEGDGASSSESSGSTIYVGTRESKLAMWQANFVADLLRERYPEKKFVVRGMTTPGDRDQLKPLRDFGSKGLFTKELDEGLFDRTIDCAVHCLKDLPTILPEGLVAAAILERGYVEDALILRDDHKGKTLATLPKGAKLGTSALRRAATIARWYPHLVTADIRGNVGSRMEKMESGLFDGIILARAGLNRLGLDDRVAEILDTKMGYAVGQGALVIACREEDAELRAMFGTLDHLETRLACDAERSMLRTVEGGCKVPLSVRCQIGHTDGVPSSMSLWVGVMSIDGQRLIEEELKTDLAPERSEALKGAVELGVRVGQAVLAKGAAELLETLRPSPAAAASSSSSATSSASS